MFSFRHDIIFFISILLFPLCIYGLDSNDLFDDSSAESCQEIEVRQIKPSGKKEMTLGEYANFLFTRNS